MTAPTKAGTNLKTQINGLCGADQQAVNAIDEYLRDKGEEQPHRLLAKAAYELVSNDSSYINNEFFLDALLGLEAVMMKPENIQAFTGKVNVTGKGLETALTALKRFFAAFYDKPLMAEMYRVGLTEYNDRYFLPELDGPQVFEEVKTFR